MEFKGRYVISSPTEKVWAALHDPDVLARSIPGAQSVTQTGPENFAAKAVIKVGPVKATFEGKVTVTDQAPPPGYTHAGTLKGEGQGGAAGFARGEAKVLLAHEGSGSILTYDAQAVIGGRLAQIGQRLIDGAAKAIADEFFANFAKQVSPAEPAPEPIASAKPPAESESEGLAPQIWIVGLIGIVIILLVVFGLVL